MDELIRIGVDLGKRYFQIHGVRSGGGPAEKRKLSRSKMHAFFSGLAPCRVGMEACGSAHYWARELGAMGREVVLMPPAYIKPYVKRGKNDAIDATAICEAMARPDMRFVPVKSADQQALLMLHKTRELMVKQRTMSVNALRSRLAEFGLVVAQGVGRIDDLRDLAETNPSLPDEARQAMKLSVLHIEALTRSIDAIERKIAKAAAGNRTSRLLDRVPGVGPVTASAIAASAPNPGVFKSGRDFAAWLGLTPRQNSSGGKTRLGGITKQGNRYIRKLLVVGATAALRHAASKRSGPLADWVAALRKRKPERVVTVALANKLARVCWAIMTTGEFFRQETFARA